MLLSGRAGPPGGVFDGILPTTQDYLISVQAKGGTGADYTLEITIEGTAMDVSPSARIITLAEPVAGFAVIALTDESNVLSASGGEILLRDIRAGVRIQASGRPGETNVLLASQALLLAD